MVLRRYAAAAALLSTSVATAACNTQRQVDASVLPAAELGRFSFAIETRDGIRMTGLLDVSADTVVARLESAPCRVMAERSSNAAISYECKVPGTSGVRLSLDRRYPLRRSTWSVLTPVRRRRDVCTEYRTWENGTRSCVTSMPEEYIEQVFVTGELVVIR
ncbi:MAG TPA: hypothetical protein VF128_12780 [Gemmatimonadaceae bacterium]